MGWYSASKLISFWRDCDAPRGRIDDVEALPIAHLKLQPVGDDTREIVGRADDHRGLARIIEIELVAHRIGREAAERAVEVGAFAVLGDRRKERGPRPSRSLEG
jgi:hypothetical protein